VNESRGLGDWAEAVARFTGRAWLARRYELLIGPPCRCARRKVTQSHAESYPGRPSRETVRLERFHGCHRMTFTMLHCPASFMVQ
jgi:hypothetical protein